MSPLLSVLIITYNHEAYIAEAIESALNQNTNFNYEILIGDDCSIDNTGIIVREYAKENPKKIRLITSIHNVGAIKNEKRLIDTSKGKYLAFLEGDDFWTDPFKLQKQVDFLEANPDFGLVHSDVNHYYENTGETELHVNKSKGNKIPEGDVFYNLLKPDPLFIKTATTCFRKELVTKYFDYELALKENWPLTDLPLWMDITYHSKAHYFDEVFATYRLLNESASRTSSPVKKYNYHKELYKIKQNYIAKYNCNEKIRNELEEDYYRNMIKIAFNLNDKKLAQESVNFLKNNNLAITQKERLMLLSIKNKLIRRAINFIKTKNTLMNKLVKKIINSILSTLFLCIKDESKKEKVFTFVSRFLFDKNNSLEYDSGFKSYWLKHKNEYLFIVKKPIYNFSKKNLYKSIRNIYCKNYSPQKDDIIIDIGAGLGTETLFFSESVGKNGRIYSIEASTDSYNKLNALCVKNKIENSLNYNIAISNFNGKIWMEETEHFEVNQINKIQKGIEINCYTLDQFVQDKAISKIDMLKVNIEGAELEMIDGMQNAIKIIDNVAVSCHDFLFKDERNIKKKMITFLTSNGFELFFNETGNVIIDSWIYGKRK